jgi:hypothetical protein
MSAAMNCSLILPSPPPSPTGFRRDWGKSADHASLVRIIIRHYVWALKQIRQKLHESNPCRIPLVVRRTLTLLQLPPVRSARSRLRDHGTTGWPIRSHGQACNLQYHSNRNVHHQNHLGTRTQFVDSKQATRTTFEPCPPAGVPTTHFRDTRDLWRPAPGRCNWWTHSLKIKYILA